MENHLENSFVHIPPKTAPPRREVATQRPAQYLVKPAHNGDVRPGEDNISVLVCWIVVAVGGLHRLAVLTRTVTVRAWLGGGAGLSHGEHSAVRTGTRVTPPRAPGAGCWGAAEGGVEAEDFCVSAETGHRVGYADVPAPPVINTTPVFQQPGPERGQQEGERQPRHHTPPHSTTQQWLANTYQVKFMNHSQEICRFFDTMTGPRF